MIVFPVEVLVYGCSRSDRDALPRSGAKSTRVGDRVTESPAPRPREGITQPPEGKPLARRVVKWISTGGFTRTHQPL